MSMLGKIWICLEIPKYFTKTLTFVKRPVIKFSFDLEGNLHIPEAFNSQDRKIASIFFIFITFFSSYPQIIFFSNHKNRTNWFPFDNIRTNFLSRRFCPQSSTAISNWQRSENVQCELTVELSNLKFSLFAFIAILISLRLLSRFLKETKSQCFQGHFFKGIDRARLANDSRSAASDWFFLMENTVGKANFHFSPSLFYLASDFLDMVPSDILFNIHQYDFECAIKFQQLLTLCLSASSSLSFTESKIDCFKRFKYQLPAGRKCEKRKSMPKNFAFHPRWLCSRSK